MVQQRFGLLLFTVHHELAAQPVPVGEDAVPVGEEAVPVGEDDASRSVSGAAGIDHYAVAVNSSITATPKFTGSGSRRFTAGSEI